MPRRAALQSLVALERVGGTEKQYARDRAKYHPVKGGTHSFARLETLRADFRRLFKRDTGD